MTTVSVVTAGGGDTYRIERVYLDRDETYGLARLTRIAPVEPVQVANGVRRTPDGAEWWARVPVSKRGVSCGTPSTAIGATTSTSADKGGRDALPEPKSAIANSPGYPRSRWQACRTRK